MISESVFYEKHIIPIIDLVIHHINELDLNQPYH